MSHILHASWPTTAYASRLLISENFNLLSEVTLILVLHNGGFFLQRLLEGKKTLRAGRKEAEAIHRRLSKSLCLFPIFVYIGRR